MILSNKSLKEFCNYRTGGCAEYYAAVRTDDDLAEALKFAKEKSLDVTVIGGGFNILVCDEGVKGLVINTSGLNDLVTISGTQVYAGSGVGLDALVRMTGQKALAGLENMSGIPGCVGGAVKMNAGAFGTEIKDVAVYVDMMRMNGERYRVSAADAGFGYRKAAGLDGIVLGAMFGLSDGAAEELKAKRAEILKKRNEKQPLDHPSCGSVFKRPEGNFAGTLIEQCGLKGFRIGGAQVAEKHANFILNINHATSADIYGVMCHVQKTVEEKTGIRLEMEVRLIGFGQGQTR